MTITTSIEEFGFRARAMLDAEPEPIEEPEPEEPEPIEEPEYKKDFKKWVNSIDDLFMFSQIPWEEMITDWKKTWNEEEWKEQFNKCHSDGDIQKLTEKLLKELHPNHIQTLKEELKDQKKRPGEL
tara:strand:- start:261 stop:638 length:378 start_codon:yes stop_codon:yes gene_type:complete